MAPILHWTISQPQGTKIKKRQHIFWYLTILWWMRNDFNERINRWMFKILSSRRMYDRRSSYPLWPRLASLVSSLIWIDPMPHTECQIMDLKTKRDLRKNLKKTFSLNFSFPFCGYNRKIFQIQLKKKNGEYLMSYQFGFPWEILVAQITFMPVADLLMHIEGCNMAEFLSTNLAWEGKQKIFTLVL